MLKQFIKICLISLLFVSYNISAHEQILREYLDAYRKGDVAGLPMTDTLQEGYFFQFQKTHDRKLTLKNVRWSEHRITADYYSDIDGKKCQGSMTLWIKDNNLIYKIIADDKVHEETKNTNLADTGQAADKASTVAVIATGAGHEANPALASFGPAGFVALGAGMIAMRQGIVKDKSLGECMSSSKFIGAVGWGTAGNNMLVLVGMGPFGLLGGVAAGAVAANQEYKNDCVEGPVRIASMST